MSDTGKANDLLAQIPRGEKKGLPPVHLWNPPFCGDIDMRIARDGTWFYLGTPIGRKPMVKLFSSIIRRDGDDYFLVTPVEKVGIRVDDAPFVAVTLQVQGEGGAQVLRFATNVEDEVEADAGHPLRVEIDPAARNPRPTCGCATTSRRWCIATCSTSWSSWRCRAGSTASNGSASGATASSFPSARSRTDRRSMKKGSRGAFFVCLTCWGSSARRYLPAPPR